MLLQFYAFYFSGFNRDIYEVIWFARISINKSIFWTYLVASLIFLLRLPISFSVCMKGGKKPASPKPLAFQLMTVSISPWEESSLLSLMLQSLLNKHNEHRCFLAGDTVHTEVTTQGIAQLQLLCAEICGPNNSVLPKETSCEVEQPCWVS